VRLKPLTRRILRPARLCPIMALESGPPEPFHVSSHHGVDRGGSGLIVSSWQGFKDPPWEGFFIGKFLWSILVGAGAGAALWLADNRGVLLIDNPGVFAFAVVAVERVVGEAYKGFFRPGATRRIFEAVAALWGDAGSICR